MDIIAFFLVSSVFRFEQEIVVHVRRGRGIVDEPGFRYALVCPDGREIEGEGFVGDRDLGDAPYHAGFGV
ncbi:MAG: hypothetical protein MZV63_57490 [Marinilabiliales bacterium]|nr:hypothetical protein [Marinilabiliales bacterium]